MKTFVPFHKIGNQKVTIVDGLHPQNLCFSHWKGANTIREIAADTSGEIVLNALSVHYTGIENPLVSATHFDIDGFVGVFALFYPELALSFKEELIAMARIGDFREFRPNNENDDYALKLCCWMNKVEKDKFYRPFENKDEIENCVRKFDFFLQVFPDVLQNIDQYKENWETEYNLVVSGIKFEIKACAYKNIGLIKKEFEHPSHYYALFNSSEGFDILLAIYPDNRYELEYKYTTWIDLASRPNLPRVDLKPLVFDLNQIETSGYRWKVDSIADTGPIVRLESAELTKADRFANPSERTIYSSSISPKNFEDKILSYFSNIYQLIEPKKNWTWSEMRSLNH